METYAEKLTKETFSVHHNPNCPSPFEVRLVGKSAGRLDNLYRQFTRDILGYGRTFEEAAKEAWIKRYGNN